MGNSSWTNQTQLVVDLPDGTTYERPEPTDVDHTYELDDCVYNMDGTLSADGTTYTGGTWTMAVETTLEFMG